MLTSCYFILVQHSLSLVYSLIALRHKKSNNNISFETIICKASKITRQLQPRILALARQAEDETVVFWATLHRTLVRNEMALKTLLVLETPATRSERDENRTTTLTTPDRSQVCLHPVSRQPVIWDQIDRISTVTIQPIYIKIITEKFYLQLCWIRFFQSYCTSRFSSRLLVPPNHQSHWCLHWQEQSVVFRPTSGQSIHHFEEIRAA